MIELMPCDIYLCRTPYTLSKIIRFCTRHIGEGRSQFSHCGIITAGGTNPIITEALTHVRTHPLSESIADPAIEYAIYRPLDLLPEEKSAIVTKALSYDGRDYGYFKLVLHLLDFAFDGIYLFRRIGRMDKYPICSYVVACAYASVKKYFGVAPQAASPDDIGDFVQSHPTKYVLITKRGNF